MAIEYQNIRVGLNDDWYGKKLPNKWVISSYEIYNSESEPPSLLMAQLQGVGLGTPKLTEPNPTTNALKNQEPKSPLEQANAEKLAKLESEKEFLRLKEQEKERKAALKKKLEHERGNAGNIESQTKIEVGEDIPAQALAQIPKSRVRLNEREIYDLNYAIVKAKDLKPSFSTGGTQKRTDMNEEQIKSIAENFDPKKIFGSGGFEDLPIILQDGQVIAGNHRIAGMLNFTPQVELSLKGIVRILEVLLSLDFFKNANEIDSSLRNSIEWLTHAGESLKAKMREYESFFSDFNTSMKANEQEVSATLNAN
ncbi:hypothetical protein HpHA65_13200 [Helicobacter pylori]